MLKEHDGHNSVGLDKKYHFWNYLDPEISDLPPSICMFEYPLWGSEIVLGVECVDFLDLTYRIVCGISYIRGRRN